MEQSRNAYEPSAGGAPANPQLLELRRLQTELSNLLAVYKDTYPDVVLTRKRINELKAQMTKTEPADKAGSKTNELKELSPQEINPEIYNNLIIVKSQIATLRDRISDTRRQIKTFEKRVEEAPANEQKFADLSRDYNISLNNYQALLGKKLSANLAENLEKRQKGERFTVLDPANLPEKPYKPKKFAVTLIGTAVGAGVGVGLVFLLESLTPMFRTKEDLGEFIDMPVLAVVPLFASSAQAKRTDMRKSKRNDERT